MTLTDSTIAADLAAQLPCRFCTLEEGDSDCPVHPTTERGAWRKAG